jgi:hypothetical protein
MTIQRLTFLFVSVFLAAALDAAEEVKLLSQETLAPYGLTRSWFNQLDISPRRSKVLHTLAEGDSLFVITSDSKLHVLDSETGQVRWMRTLGKRDILLQFPAANSRMVAVVNSSELFIMNRKDGKMLVHTGLNGAASAGCVMSENYVYIPMMDKKIVVFPLEEDTGTGNESKKETAAAKKKNNEQTEQPSSVDEERDPVLANIVKKFAEAKDSVMREKAPDAKEKELRLKEITPYPLATLTFGTVLVSPLISTEVLAFDGNEVTAHREIITWTNDRGRLLTAAIFSLSQEKFDLQYMVDSSAQTYYLGSDRIARREWDMNKDLPSTPSGNQCLPPLYQSDKTGGFRVPSLVVVGGKAGYVFAVKDRTGEVSWQYPAKGPITERIGVVGLDVYCPLQGGGMHCLDIMTGKEKWFTPGVRQFVAASVNRLYMLDTNRRLLILERKSGKQLTAFDIRQFDHFYFNVETDRIFVVNDSGFIQCLYERRPQSDAELLANKAIPPIQHRLNKAQYWDVFKGKPAPVLYWEKDAPAAVVVNTKEAEKPKTEPKEEPKAESKEEETPDEKAEGSPEETPDEKTEGSPEVIPDEKEEEETEKKDNPF